MRLDEGERVGRDEALVVDALQQRDLGLRGREGHADRTPVRVHPGTEDAGLYDVAGGARRVRRAQNNGDATLGAHVAVRASVESATETARRQHRGLREADEADRACKDVHTDDDSGVDASGLDRHRGLVQRDERR